MGEQVFQVAAYLGLIVVLIIVVGIMVGRLNRGGLKLGGAIKVVASLSLGVKEKLVLVQLGDRQLLLGITPSNISRLESFDDPVVPLEEGESMDFRHKLQEIMQSNQGSR